MNKAEKIKRTPADIEAAMQEVEEKSRLFTEAHKDDNSLEISRYGNSRIEISNDLEEAAKNYEEDAIFYAARRISDFFKAGAEWQKEKMMEDAVDGEIYFNMDYLQYHINTEPLTHFHHGDKVKLIIVKEE